MPIRIPALLAVGLIAVTSCSIEETQKGAEGTPNFKADIQQACDEIPDAYVYFSERDAIWDQACRQALVDIEHAQSKLEFLTVLERLLDDLYDPHISLNTNSGRSPRLIPSGADVWIAPNNDRPNNRTYGVVAVRPGGGAAKAGVAVGDRLVSFNARTPEELIATRIHSKPELSTNSRINWALNAAIAGYRHEQRMLVVERDGVQLNFDLGAPEPEQTVEVVSSKTVGNQIGYIRFHNSLGNSETVSAFDAALDNFIGSNGLIIDLRDTPGGGNTDVAEPILGRLIDAVAPYQVTVDPKEGVTIRSISPTGSWSYRQPIIALVGRWTGSMGEGMAIGLDGMSRAVLMGDCMAGLAGGVNELVLAQSGVSIRIPAYDLTHVNGVPRHLWCVETPQTADLGDGKDVLLEQAVTILGETDNRQSDKLEISFFVASRKVKRSSGHNITAHRRQTIDCALSRDLTA